MILSKELYVDVGDHVNKRHDDVIKRLTYG
jgi:hypothetical protein